MSEPNPERMMGVLNALRDAFDESNKLMHDMETVSVEELEGLVRFVLTAMVRYWPMPPSRMMGSLAMGQLEVGYGALVQESYVLKKLMSEAADSRKDTVN